MSGTGFLAGLFAKRAGLGSAAKVAVASTTAALTLTLAGGAAGVVALAGHSGDAGTPVQTHQAARVGDPVTLPASGATNVQAGGDASVTTPSGSTSAGGGVSVPTPSVPTSPATNVARAVVPPAGTIPSLPVPGGAVPDVSGLTQLPTQVLGCLTPILDLVSGMPTVPMDQITKIGPTIVSCVSGIVAGMPLPFGLNACISEIMGFVSGITAQLPTGMPDVSGFNVAACIPSGIPVPTGMSGGFPFMGGGMPFGR